MSRRFLLAVLLLVAATGLALAPAECSESSEGDGPTCKTVFGYVTPLG